MFLIIEIGDSHSELFPFYIKHIPQEQVTWLLNKDLKDKIPFICEDQIIWHNFDRSFSTISLLLKLFNSIKVQSIKTIILNTAQGSTIRVLCLFLLLCRKVKVIGVIHNGKKLIRSFSQKVIGLKVKKYMCLAQYIKKKYKKRTSQHSNRIFLFRRQDLEN